MPARRISNRFPSPIAIDDTALTVEIARLTIDQIAVFSAEYRRVADSPSNRMIFIRREDAPDEQERSEDGTYKVPIAAIAERRLKEMPPAQRAEYDRLDLEDETFVRRVLVESITAYVTVPEGQLEEEDGTAVTTGVQLLRLYAGRHDVLSALYQAIHTENTMSEAQKKLQRSLSALRRSWAKHVQAASGPTPEPAAAGVETAASAESEAATATPSATPSGSADDAIVH